MQLFALVVFACITTEGYINPPETAEVKCIFNQNDSACNYAVGIGVLGFLACVAFLLLDVYVPFSSNVAEKKYAVLADLGFSGTLVPGVFNQEKKEKRVECGEGSHVFQSGGLEASRSADGQVETMKVLCKDQAVSSEE